MKQILATLYWHSLSDGKANQFHADMCEVLYAANMPRNGKEIKSFILVPAESIFSITVLVIAATVVAS
jgi:hypothetical protein